MKSLDIQDRVFKTTDRNCFVTLKDHKPGFKNSPSCRLLNPTKCEIGKISHQILSKVIETVRVKSGLNQWKNVYSCIEWYENLENKSDLTFLIFDIVNFYPTITQDLLKNALEWAGNYTSISEKDKDAIFQARKSLLIYNGTPWTKKNNPDFYTVSPDDYY